MARDEQVALARAGVDHWNKWRKSSKERADLSGHSFNSASDRGMSFDRFEFGDHMSFRNTHFTHWINFRKAKFGQRANFENSFFGSDAVFQETSFLESPNFDNSTFVGRAIFKDLIFPTSVSFQGCSFRKTLVFENVEFLGFADFREARFQVDRVTFRDCKFVEVDFSGPTSDASEKLIFPIVSFSKVQFSKPASFNNRNFNGTTDFRDTAFSVAPSFHNSDLHQDTSFIRVHFKDIATEAAERAYRTLKLAMNKHHAHTEEMMFFGLEMRARRHKEPWHSAWLYWLYETFSDYGQSIIRPICAILSSFVVFLLTYWFALFNSKLEEIAAPDGMERIGQLYVFTLSHTLLFLRPFLKLGENLPWKGMSQPALVTLLVGLQTTVALILSFLLLLGLRNRFRLKS